MSAHPINHPSRRPFTRVAALMAFGPEGLKALEDNRCPDCKQPFGSNFRDDASRREWEISGLCQRCQDRVFGATGEE